MQSSSALSGDIENPQLPDAYPDDLEVEFDEEQSKTERIEQAIDELSEREGWLIESCRVRGVFGWGVYLRGELVDKFCSRQAAANFCNANYDFDIYGDDVSVEELGEND